VVDSRRAAASSPGALIPSHGPCPSASPSAGHEPVESARTGCVCSFQAGSNSDARSPPPRRGRPSRRRREHCWAPVHTSIARNAGRPRGPRDNELGPSLAGAGTTHVWLYLLGPAIGAVLGCLITLAVHGRYKPRKDAAQGNGEDDVTTATRQPRAVWLSSWRVLGGARRPDLITARPVLSLSAGPRGGAAALGGVAQGWRGRARLRASG